MFNAFPMLIHYKCKNFCFYCLKRKNKIKKKRFSFTHVTLNRPFFQVEIEGLTGEIRFSDDGRRQNYTLGVVEMTVNSAMVKVAEWSDETEFIPIAAKYVRLRPKSEFERNKTYIVTSIVEEPYIMESMPDKGEVLEGNRRYEGYCKDLADLIAQKLGINCEY